MLLQLMTKENTSELTGIWQVLEVILLEEVLGFPDHFSKDVSKTRLLVLNQVLHHNICKFPILSDSSYLVLYYRQNLP